MKTYFEIAETASEDRRLLALDLARRLETLSLQLDDYDEILLKTPWVLKDRDENRMYFSLVRAYLAVQQQFVKLLPKEAGENVSDALAAFVSDGEAR